MSSKIGSKKASVQNTLPNDEMNEKNMNKFRSQPNSKHQTKRIVANPEYE